MKRFNLKELDDGGVKEQYQVKISNKFANLENLGDDMDINRAWESNTESMKASATENLGYYELKP
jgi:hypothetical protein